MLKRILYSRSLSLLSSQAAITVMNFAASALIARSFGPADFGVYTGFNRVSVLALSFFSLSIGHSIAQFTSTREMGSSQLREASLRASLLLGPVSSLPVLFYAIAVGKEALFLGVFWALSMPVSMLGLFGLHQLRSAQSLKHFVVARMAAPGLWLCATATLVSVGSLSLSALGAAWLVSQMAYTSVVYLLLLRHRLQRETGPGSLRSLIKFGLGSHLAVVGRDVSPLVDQFVVLFLLGTTALGTYAPGATLAAVVSTAGISLTLTIQPSIARLGDAKDQATVIAIRSASLAFLLGTTVAAAILLFSSVIVGLTYGPSFTDAVPIAQVMSVGALGDIVTMSIVAALLGLGLSAYASGVQLTSTIMVGTGAISSPTLFDWSSPALGAAVGATTGHLLGAVIAVIVFSFLMRPRLRHVCSALGLRDNR